MGDYRWGGNKHEPKVDPARCLESVHGDGRWPSFHQCRRKRTVGDRCRQHSPDYVKAKDAEREARWEAQEENAKNARERRAFLIVSEVYGLTVDELKAALSGIDRAEEGE